jgi:hypothetical protein
MPKREPIETKAIAKEVVVKTKDKPRIDEATRSYKWWLAQNNKELTDQLLSTTNYLSKTSQIRVRQASIFARLFSGKPLYNYLANVGTLDNSQQLPIGRPTANVCYSCTDTLTSRITQDKPRPVFLTNNAHYRERKISETMNDFILGEFSRLNTYQLGAFACRDSCVIGDGLVKVYRRDNKVAHERTLATELLVDYNDSYYGRPLSLIQKKMIDRTYAMALDPGKEDIISKAMNGKVDNTPLSTDTVSDQFIVSEGWRLPSGKDTNDGRHVIVCSAGVLVDEPWKRQKFPFAKLGYNPNPVGWFSQSLCEILMPTQMEIYKMLIIASQAIELMGVPRVLIDEFSAILETAFNNNLGSIIKYKNVKPEFINAISNPPEIYEWIKWLIENAYQMSGVSSMSAGNKLPAGLQSGEAQRVYLDTQDTRFAAFQRRYQDFYTDLAYLTIEEAAEIAKDTGEYLTVYPGKDGTREVDLPESVVLKDTYVIQCYEESSLPKDPGGRQAKLSEMFAAGEIDKSEFRFMSKLPDLSQSDSLANALRERILKTLDDIIEDGAKGYKPPDPFILDPSDMATTLVVQYINKYIISDIEKNKIDLLRDWFDHIQFLKAQAAPPPPQPAPAPMNGQGQKPPMPVAPPAPSNSPISNVRV